MPGLKRLIGPCAGLAALAFFLGEPLPALSQAFWQINERGSSPIVTGAATAPFPVQPLPSAEEQLPPELSDAPIVQAQVTPSAQSQVDESALRFFARQGDTRRLEIEIARLRALYPDWTPPADPLAVPQNGDERLESIWELYAAGRLAEARRAIAERQSEETEWEPPADLIDRLELAEARERLLNASRISQHDTVIRIASDNAQLLTCAEVDVLWRVAEAFARTERPARAADAYRYILENCDNPQERLATLQNARQLLDQAFFEPLLRLERVDEEGAGEFEVLEDQFARDLLARSGSDAAIEVPAVQLARVEQLFQEEGSASDALLLGWHHLLRENHDQAETWFRRARQNQDTAEAAEGLALALMPQGQYSEAEQIMHPWRDESSEAQGVYLAAAANLLGEDPRPVLSSEVLSRIVDASVAARDVATARQLGWYARSWEQHETARLWFETALEWDGDDEPSAYGLALSYQELEETTALQEIRRLWAERSERILQLGTAPADSPAAPVPRPRPDPATRSRATSSGEPAVSVAAQPATVSPRASSPQGCSAHLDARQLSPEAALRRAWCLMDAQRPVEAVQAFERAVTSSAQRTRQDAAWGQSLAYLQLEMVDHAAVAAIAVPQDAQRANELQTAILAQRAAGAFERGRYVEALLALDQRAQIAPERIDLMVVRGYAYLNLNRLADARRVFQAVAGTGNRDGLRGLAEVDRRVWQMD